MNATQRTGILSPATGLLVFDINTNSFWFRNTARWVELIDSSNTIWTKAGSNVYVNNGENVGVGTLTPDVRLHVTNGSDATLVNGGYLQLGSTASSNPVFDNNEILTRNNGAASDLFLQYGGGNVAVGGITPTSKLDVNGQITMRGGLPGIDKVLSSDANGTATWRTSSRGTGFFVEASILQSVPNNTYTKVNFPTINYDDGANYNTVNDYYNCPTAGFYHFDAKILIELNSTITNGSPIVTLRISKNGTSITNNSINIPAIAGKTDYVTISINLYLAANDHILIMANQDTGNAQDVAGIFSGYWLY
ncbi:MAG: hypothetical protein ABIX01_01105 [Chitinophagaceae bacterium]